MSVDIVILAAGLSSRFNGIKALATYQNKTLLTHTLLAASNSDASQVNIVLGAHQDEIKASNNLDEYNVIYNPNFATGMASSIKLGVDTLKDRDALLMLTVDQPLITATELNKLMSKFKQSQNTIVASQYAKTIGIPAIFPRNSYSELMRLTGDQGAKKLFKESTTLSVPVPEAEFDIDRPEDLQRLNTSHEL